jgi:replicative DNA helicase
MLNNQINLSNKRDYLTNHFSAEKSDRNKNKHLRTGIKCIDGRLPMRNGIYLLGGCPGIGKTSAMLQFIDSFAEQGNTVLFFSLEQVECDLTIKSINRLMHKNSISEQEAIEIYSSFADNIITATAEGSVAVEDLVKSVEEVINTTNRKPIVFVDYLQLLHTNKPLQKREEIEEVSHQLVALSKKHGLTIFVISSLNRTNYLAPIDYESFKESGSLEYDADVVLGLQYQIVSDQTFTNTASVDKRRLLIGQEKVKTTRSVELTCIKNRFGPIFESCKMNYLADQDLFIDPQSTVGTIQASKKQVCSF